MTKKISSSQTARVAQSRTMQTEYLSDPQRHAHSKTRSIPPRGVPSPPPFPIALSVVHRWSSSLKEADHCKTNVRAETMRYASSHSLQKPGESNDSPLLKKPRRLIGNGLKQVKRDLGELDAPQVRSYRTVNGGKHRSLQWERPKSDEPRHPSHEGDVRHKREADASNSMSDARQMVPPIC
jgi:hypothetical protein